MTRYVSALTSVLAIAAVACGSHEGAPDSMDTSQQEVNRGEIGGPPQVMALMITEMVDFGNGPEPSLNICSGTLYAEKTLVTAAHCLDGEVIDVQAYYGENIFIEEDFTTIVPVTSWQLHPSYDPSTYKADIAIVSLGADVPFKPLPLAFLPLHSKFVGKELTIAGYGIDPSGTEWDAPLVKRTGETTYEGYPTGTLPEDPHPGLDDPRIRRTLMQVDSEAPAAGMCFGDSGGPALLRFGKHDFIVGVGHWADPYCEQYAFYTRVQPYLPFLLSVYWNRGKVTE